MSKGAEDRTVPISEGPREEPETDAGLEKHLEFIQVTINRMAGCSFLIKGWSVTLAVGLVALAAKDSNPKFVFLALFPIVMLWLLDGFFLRQERLFRRLYDAVRKGTDTGGPYSMSTQPYLDQEPNTFLSAFAGTLIGFHGVIIVAIGVIAYIITHTGG